MGITGFHKQLASIGISQAKFVTKLGSYKFKYVFVDFSLVYMAFAMTMSANRKPGVLLDPKRRELSIATMARYIYNELNNLKVDNIYIVLDGDAPVEKEKERDKRRQAGIIRRMHAITKFYNGGISQKYLKSMRQSNPSIFSPPNYREEVAYEIMRLGFPLIRAECEAEAMCVGLAYKFRKKKAAVYTRDTDVYCMGNPFTIYRSVSSDKYNRKIFSFAKLFAAFKNYIIEGDICTNCTPLQFKMVCILLGCDFTTISLDIHIAINIVFNKVDLSIDNRLLTAWREMQKVLRLFDCTKTGVESLNYSKCTKTGDVIISHPKRVIRKSKNDKTVVPSKIEIIPDMKELESVF